MRSNRPLVAIDLGLADPIKAAAAAWREKFGQFADDNDNPGQTLRRLVWQPLAPHFSDATTILISPDGALSWVPWSALPGSQPNTYLIEERSITVVPVPNLIPEISQAKVDDMAEPSLLAIGDVDYGASPGRATLVADALGAPRIGRPPRFLRPVAAAGQHAPRDRGH